MSWLSAWRSAMQALLAKNRDSALLDGGLRQDKIPTHVAIIMDGNGRWASRRGLPRIVGHRAGSENVRRVVERAGALGVRYLTLYAFSTENWNRPKDEVDALMSLLREMFTAHIDEMVESGVRVMVIGRLEELPPDIQAILSQAVDRTRHCTNITVTYALNYGGRAELVDCIRSLCRDAVSGAIDPNSVSERDIQQRLYTKDIPDPDLLIRTSGEMRLSNFLLWQVAYTEIVVTDTLWPDFGVKDFDRALALYQGRDRRFGGLSKKSKGE